MIVIKCPFCGYESGTEDFKLLREPWKFKFYIIRMLECLGVTRSSTIIRD